MRVWTAEEAVEAALDAGFAGTHWHMAGEELAVLLNRVEERRCSHHLNSSRTVAVGDHEFLPMADCPRGVKVQLLTPGHVAVYGVWDGKGSYLGWYPVPKIPKEITNASAR